MTLASHLWHLAVGFKLCLSCPNPSLLFSHRTSCTLRVTWWANGCCCVGAQGRHRGITPADFTGTFSLSHGLKKHSSCTRLSLVAMHPRFVSFKKRIKIILPVFSFLFWNSCILFHCTLFFFCSQVALYTLAY